MCDIWKRREGGEFPVDDLDRHRESLRALGVREVVLTGGEPLLHRGLEAVCEFFQGLGVRITLLTTGLLLERTAAIVAGGVDEIIVSLDGPADIHDAIRRVPRAFERLASGIAAVRSLRASMPISCRTTVQKQNHWRLRATADAARSLGLDSISFLPADLLSTAFDRAEPWTPERQSEIALSESEVLALEREMERIIETRGDEIRSGFIVEDESKLRRIAARFREHLEGTTPTSPRCNAPWVSTVLEVNGDLRPCFFHPVMASTEGLTLEEAVNSEAAIAFRDQLDVATDPICNRCVCSLSYKG